MIHILETFVAVCAAIVATDLFWEWISPDDED